MVRTSVKEQESEAKRPERDRDTHTQKNRHSACLLKVK